MTAVIRLPAHRLRAQKFTRRGLEALHAVCLLLVILPLAAPAASLQAQAMLASSSNTELPNAPGFLQASQSTGQSAAISGAVTDLSGALVSGALIKLEAEHSTPLAQRSLHTDSTGHFTFSGLAAGVYHFNLFAPGLQNYVSEPLTLTTGEHLELPNITLALAGASTSITVGGNSTEVAEAELHQQIQQRTFGIFPNFRTSYVWNAAPLSAQQKYKLTLLNIADPISFIGLALSAELQTNNDTFPQWGRDAPSYGKRFGAVFGNSLFSRGFDTAVFPALFHQDPRYFYMGPAQPTRKRLIHAIQSGLIVRGDNGHLQPNYSHFAGNAAAGALSSVYHPASNSAGELALTNTAIRIGFDGLDCLLREFIIPHLVHHRPPYANGEPAGSTQP